jgi:lipoprotein-anchoring transpeptidase ErfK/SrfK
MNILRNITFVGAALVAATVSTSTLANPFSLHSRQAMPQYQIEVEEPTQSTEMPAHLKRQIVAYNGNEAPGTIIIDTANTYLYLVQPGGRALRYGIGVGRDGFRWSGVQTITKKAEWPDWHPPAEMIARQPYLPRFMAGGPTNPLGARAMYLGNTIYRIHGTNAPGTIGTRVSSGCIRLTNEDVTDLASRVNVGTKVIVLNNERTVTAPAPSTSYAPVAPSRAQQVWQTIR